MGCRCTLDYYGSNFAPLVDKQIGTAFWTVKCVHDNLENIAYVVTNMEAIITLATQVTTLQTQVAALQAQVAALTPH